MRRKPRVLFLCTHNSARSQMAEAFLRHAAGEHFEAHSAGLEATEIHPMTLQVMREVGIDLVAEGRRSKSLIDEYLTPRVHIGYLITVCQKAEKQCPTYPGVGLREYWEIEDPAAAEGGEQERLDAFRAARDEIASRVADFIEREVRDSA
jgi:arsenate reductase (thioredoxin)